MKNIWIGMIIMISPFLSFGHNPLAAKYNLEAGAQASLLTINLSQNGVNQALLKKYSKEKLEEMSQQEWKELIVDYIKNNFSLSFDKKEIQLKKGGIKLGSHQTDLKFVLPPVSKNIETIDIHIPAFQENEHHQTIFYYNLNGNADHAILSSLNNYQITIQFSTQAQASSQFWYILIAFSTLILIFLIKKNTEPNKNKVLALY